MAAFASKRPDSRHVKHRYTKCHKALIAALEQGRLAAGLSQRDASALLKRGKNFVQVVESGERSISVCEFVEYAQIIGIDPHAVIDLLKTQLPAPRRKKSPQTNPDAL